MFFNIIVMSHAFTNFRPNATSSACGSFMVALWNRETIYIFMLWFVLCSFFLFPRLISAVGDWMFTILWHMVWP